jgi:transglutaminase-like putative cysteine protease
MDKVESIFHFVRDEIKLGFTSKWDVVKASEVLTYGISYCSPQATLFVALCRAAGIGARVHCAVIDAEIMRGVFPSIAFPFLPKAGGHAWTEVQIEGQWQ